MDSRRSSHNKIGRLLIPLVVILSLASCQSRPPEQAGGVLLEPVAFSDRQWTGLAVSAQGRLFVNYPRWSDDLPVSVAELIDGDVIPYPDISMNEWEPGKDPTTHLICVQAVYVDDRDRLWILDPANPQFRGVVPGGPKLLQVDPASDRVVRTFRFGDDTVLANSYLNDVRIDTHREFAFMTDSGNGALVVLDLKSGQARRILDDHASAASEDVILVIGGRPWLRNGVPPRVHADGIAYDDRADFVYYQALTGRSMYRVPGSALRRADLSEDEIAAQVQIVGQTGASDGLIFGADGAIYISALEHDAILRTDREGKVETVIQDKAIAWPDSFSFGPEGSLYFTTSRIHEGAVPEGRYGIYRIAVPD